jgi:hypothetical protein
MTQLSPNTVAQDQIYSKLNTFIDQYRRNEFTDNKQITEEYQSIINFLNENITRTFNTI